MNQINIFFFFSLVLLVCVIKGSKLDDETRETKLKDGFKFDEKVEGSTLDEECGVHTAVLHKNGQSSNSDVIKIMRNKLKQSKKYSHRKWPWMAMIKNSTHYLCNGILIRKRFILTTASCLYNRDPSELIADLQGKTFKLQKLYKHDGFKAHRHTKLTGDLGLIKLAEPVPVSEKSGKIMSICLPRSKMQPLHAQECAVSFLWVKEKRHEVDTPAMNYDKSFCRNEPKGVGNKDLLECIETAQGMTPKDTSSQVVYFYTCKTSGYWSLFGLSKYHHQTTKDKGGNSYTYFLTLTRYLNWIKNIIYTQKATVLQNELAQ